MRLQQLESRYCCNGLLVQNVCGQGKGVFTRVPFQRGELILEFDGRLTHASEITDFTHYLQISPDEYLGPSGSFDDFVNHHCDPNCGVFFDGDRLVLKAIRDIDIDEQLSFDYGTIMFNEPTTFNCACGAKKCRKQIGNFYMLPVDIQADFLDKNLVPLLSKFTREQLGFGNYLKAV